MASFRFLALIACLVIPAIAVAQAPSQLPEDGDRYSLVVITSPQPSAAGARLLESLTTHPQLRDIASRCHVHRFTPTSEIYRQRYANAIHAGALPVIACVRADGGVIYKASGPAVPSDPGEIASELAARARIDRDLARSDGIEWSAQNAPVGDPAGFPFRDPAMFPRPLDGMIPDTVNVNPTLSVDGAMPIAVGVGVLVLLAVLGGIVVVGIVSVIIWIRH